jgi:D-alanine transaminase
VNRVRAADSRLRRDREAGLASTGTVLPIALRPCSENPRSSRRWRLDDFAFIGIVEVSPRMGWRYVMKDSVWINGQIVPRNRAYLDVEDRGYQFADGVYEVIRIYNDRPFTLDAHLDRLERSAGGIRIHVPLARPQLAEEIRKFAAAAKLSDAYLYLQLTRGVAPRNHRFPSQVRPHMLFYLLPLPPAPVPGETAGVKLLSVTDERWPRCWIKSIGLIANVLAKNDALDAGYDEAVFMHEGAVTECSTSNLFAVIDGKLVTHAVGAKVLPGITRLVVFDIAGKLGIEVEERPLSESEVVGANELFITSTTRELAWVARWNQRRVAEQCGPVTLRLHEAFRARVRSETTTGATRANRAADPGRPVV